MFVVIHSWKIIFVRERRIWDAFKKMANEKQIIFHQTQSCIVLASLASMFFLRWIFLPCSIKYNCCLPLNEYAKCPNTVNSVCSMNHANVIVHMYTRVHRTTKNVHTTALMTTKYFTKELKLNDSERTQHTVCICWMFMFTNQIWCLRVFLSFSLPLHTMRLQIHLVRTNFVRIHNLSLKNFPKCSKLDS